MDDIICLCKVYHTGEAESIKFRGSAVIRAKFGKFDIKALNESYLSEKLLCYRGFRRR